MYLQIRAIQVGIITLAQGVVTLGNYLLSIQLKPKKAAMRPFLVLVQLHLFEETLRTIKIA